METLKDSNHATLACLPFEIWQQVILYLEPHDSIPLSLVNHHFYEALIDEIYYQHIHSGTREALVFWWAVINQQHRTAERALAQGADPNRHRPMGMQAFPRLLALMVAIDKDDNDMVKLLLNFGADPLAVADQSSSIQLAVEQGKTDLVRVILSHEQAMFKAKTSELPKRAICRAPSAPNTRDPQGNTLLHCAASAGHTATVELLLEFGARIDALNTLSHPALMVAIEKAKLEVVQVLLRKGADPHMTAGFNSNDIVGHAVRFIKPEPIREQILATVAKARYNDTSPGSWMYMNENQLHGVIMNTFLREYVVLSKMGANIDARSSDGVTPLYLKAGGSRERVYLPKEIRDLDDCGADFNFQAPGTLMTPLMRAAEVGNQTTIDLLIARGANMSAVDSKGRTALAHAAMNGRYQAVFHLLPREQFITPVGRVIMTDAHPYWTGDDINEEGDDGYQDYFTSYEDGMAVKCQEAYYREAVERLISRGDVHDQLETRLEELMGRLSAESVRLIDQRDCNGQTPLMLAVSGGHFQTARTLINRGAKMDMCDDKGQTALTLARDMDRDSMIARLLRKRLA